MQNYLTGYSVTAQATAFAGSMPLREEGLLPRVLFQSARNLGTTAKAMVSRVRAANPQKTDADRANEKRGGTTQPPACSSEAEFREDLRHFLDPNPSRKPSERDN